MKIQKVIFSGSEEYSDFWEPVSQIFYEKLGIEPILIYFGDTPLSEKYGKVHKVQYSKYPKIIQLLWSRFWFTKTEPETTWLIGDIDLIPLQRDRFIDMIQDIPENFHVHLAHNRISNPPTLWQVKGPKDGGADLTAHYHVGKGRVFDANFDLHETFEESCKFLYDNKYGLGFFSKDWDTDALRYYCCCEQYSTEKLRTKLKDIDFVGLECEDSRHMTRQGRGTGPQMKPFDANLLRRGWYVDFHSIRPYMKHKETIDQIINMAWNNA